MGSDDHDGHGTLMAGLAAYGELDKCLVGSQKVYLRHRLESVKILPPKPGSNEPDLWGAITSQGVSLAEIRPLTEKNNLFGDHGYRYQG